MEMRTWLRQVAEILKVAAAHTFRASIWTSESCCSNLSRWLLCSLESLWIHDRLDSNGTEQILSHASSLAPLQLKDLWMKLPCAAMPKAGYEHGADTKGAEIGMQSEKWRNWRLYCTVLDLNICITSDFKKSKQENSELWAYNLISSGF